MSIEPIKSIDENSLNEEEHKMYSQIGTEIIKNEQIAVCILAGGQGTRLGHNGPKGTFMVPLDNPKSIFQIQVETLLRAYKEYGTHVYFFVMTSKDNDEITKQFLNDNNYFGYPKDKIKFFVQGELPLTNRNKVELQNEDGSPIMAPNGNGGIFKALEDEGIIDLMKEQNIKYLVTENVDNILANPIDAIALGILEENNSEIGIKCVDKANPEERVGNTVLKDGRPTVIEYTDFPKDLASELDENGELKYKEAHFGVNYFSLNLLNRIAEEKLPIHEAYKSNDKYGDFIKYEMFIFDGFEKANNGIAIHVNRDDEFAPIKNKEGVDSPYTAKELYVKKYKQEN